MTLIQRIYNAQSGRCPVCSCAMATEYQSYLYYLAHKDEWEALSDFKKRKKVPLAIQAGHTRGVHNSYVLIHRGCKGSRVSDDMMAGTIPVAENEAVL